jgi:site-specific recombinase XerD
MKSKNAKQTHRSPKRVLRLPDLDFAKTAVLNTLSSSDSRRSYRFAIDDFVTWYCSEPRLAFSKTVVLRYRLELEGRHLAPSTINLRLAAVRRLAYEAADTGLLSPELAAGIRRVKGAKKVGVRLGNWLTPDQAKALLNAPDIEKVRGKRDRAMLAVLLGCGLRRSELVHLSVDHFQQREDHWAIVDLIGKGGHIRTVPVPDWVKASVNVWTTMAHISTGRIFRCVNKTGSVWGTGITEKVVWSVVKEFAARVGIEQLAPHDLRRYAESWIMPNPNATTWFETCEMGRAAACLGGECGIVRQSQGPCTAPRRNGTSDALSTSLCPRRPKLATPRRLALGLRACQEKRSVAGSIILPCSTQRQDRTMPHRAVSNALQVGRNVIHSA